MLPLVAIAAAEEPPVEVALHGDVKSFFLAGDSAPWFGLSDASAPLLDAMGVTEAEALDLYGLSAAPFAQGVAAGRLKLEVTRRDALRFDLHWAIAAQTGGSTSIVPGANSGVALTAPELLRLTWRPDLGDGVALQHRIDRLVVSGKVPGLDVTIGRQPISFGSGRVFAPLDLVNPFHPATIDTEYKPGVDAIRVDGYLGVAGKLTLAAAYAGEAPAIGPDRRDGGPTLDDLVFAANGQGTVGVTDLAGFLGLVHGEPVVGVGVVSAAGPVGLHGDAALTLPDGADPFVRAVAGADWRPTEKTTLMGEVYVQTFGAPSPEGYLDALDAPRFQRGEVWQLGQIYASATAAQEITPLVSANLSVIANLRDPSALVALGGAWSVADDAVVGFGAYLGAGARPDTVDLDLVVDPQTLTPSLRPPDDAALAASVNSEFGLYPAVGFLQVRTYF